MGIYFGQEFVTPQLHQIEIITNIKFVFIYKCIGEKYEKIKNWNVYG